VTPVLGIDKRRGPQETAAPQAECHLCFTSEQFFKCAAIAAAVAGGNERYRQALYDVADFLATAATEAAGVRVLVTSGERWVRVDAWPWPPA
jgi:hypothetical protein